MMKSMMTAHQPSITEWFSYLGNVRESARVRHEDNQKNQRLEILYQTIGLPYERPTRFEARELSDANPAWRRLVARRGSELCAIRLVPKRPHLPKLRKRGWTIKQCYRRWFLKQPINPDQYYAELCPHTNKLLWSTIFVVNHRGLFGEIIRGQHSQLTHGNRRQPLYHFRYDGMRWQWDRQLAANRAAQQVAKRAIAKLKTGTASRRVLKERLGAEFNAQRYLMGYFEATVWPDHTVRFIDYNRVLARHLPLPPAEPAAATVAKRSVVGVTAYPGVAVGTAIVVTERTVGSVVFPRRSVLVCDNTDVRFLPLMKKAAAVVINRGGTLSHAAIVMRELKKPCIVATGRATKVFKTGDRIQVDATNATAITMPTVG